MTRNLTYPTRPCTGVLYGCRQIDALNHGFVAMFEWDELNSSCARSIMPYGRSAGKTEHSTNAPITASATFSPTPPKSARARWQINITQRRRPLLTAIASTTSDFTLYAANR